MRFGGFFARWVSGAVVAAALVGAGSAGAATLNVNASGILLGASGVDVGGTLYDVQFLGGTCVALFNGCDEPGDFAFTSQSDANLAANALISQVFVDGPAGNFNSVPNLTNGCSGANCFVRIPYEAAANNNGLLIVFAFNGASSNSVFNAGTSRVGDTGASGVETYALFSLPITAVPVPAALPLLLGALGVLGLVGRRRRA